MDRTPNDAVRHTRLAYTRRHETTPSGQENEGRSSLIKKGNTTRTAGTRFATNQSESINRTN
jgi:hypothetical protein